MPISLAATTCPGAAACSRELPLGVAVAVGTGVLVGGGVAVGVDVAVGSGVAVGGSGVLVGRGVAVGGPGVSVGKGVLVGGGVFVGGPGVAVGGKGVSVGGGVFVGLAVSVAASAVCASANWAALAVAVAFHSGLLVSRAAQTSTQQEQRAIKPRSANTRRRVLFFDFDKEFSTMPINTRLRARRRALYFDKEFSAMSMNTRLPNGRTLQDYEWIIEVAAAITTDIRIPINMEGDVLRAIVEAVIHPPSRPLPPLPPPDRQPSSK